MEFVDQRERGQISVISNSHYRAAENIYLLMELVDQRERRQISATSKSHYRGSKNKYLLIG